MKIDKQIKCFSIDLNHRLARKLYKMSKDNENIGNVFCEIKLNKGWRRPNHNRFWGGYQDFNKRLNNRTIYIYNSGKIGFRPPNSSNVYKINNNTHISVESLFKYLSSKLQDGIR